MLTYLRHFFSQQFSFGIYQFEYPNGQYQLSLSSWSLPTLVSIMAVEVTIIGIHFLLESIPVFKEYTFEFITATILLNFLIVLGFRYNIKINQQTMKAQATWWGIPYKSIRGNSHEITLMYRIKPKAPTPFRQPVYVAEEEDIFDMPGQPWVEFRYYPDPKGKTLEVGNLIGKAKKETKAILAFVENTLLALHPNGYESYY